MKYIIIILLLLEDRRSIRRKLRGGGERRKEITWKRFIRSSDAIELKLNFIERERHRFDRSILTADPEITEGRNSWWSIIGKATGDVRCRIRSWISV